MGYVFKNNRLETVAVELLGEGKLIHEEDDKLAEIERQFLEEKENLAKYNLQDVELVTRLFDKIGVVEFMATRTALSGVMFSQLEINNAIFENIMVPSCHKLSYVAPGDGEKKSSRNDAYKYLGSIQGVHEDVVELRVPQITAWLTALFNLDYLSLTQADNGQELPWGAKRMVDKAPVASEVKKLLQLRQSLKGSDWQLRAVDHTLKQCMEEGLKSANRFFSPAWKGALMQAASWLTEELNQALNAIDGKLVAWSDNRLYVSVTGKSSNEVADHINKCINLACSELELSAEGSFCESLQEMGESFIYKRNNDNFLRYAYLKQGD